jgi:serine/threonine-protein kinase
MRPCPECQQQVDDDARFCPFCGSASAAAEPADPMVGATVSGKFKVEKMIGQGGMGKVYRARHLTLDRPVVLKMLHRAYSDDPQIVARFQREARAASRLNHPNSIAVLDFGAAEDGTLYMAMEYLAGRDLSRVIADEFPIPEARIARIGAQILSALAEAHAQGIIHRDLKPENVMVEPRRDEADFVKVLDFGIAKITAAAENEPKLTQAGLVCGTPEYMSPEQARGAELDQRSDLYSVGVILYQLATGELPFQSDTPVGFLTKHLVEVPVPPRQRRPEVSERLDALIRRAMEKEPARRFADAGAMREALLACAAPPPVAVPATRATAPPPTLMVDVTEGALEEAPRLPASAAAPPAPAVAPQSPVRPSGSRLPLLIGGAALVAVAVVTGVLIGGRKDPVTTPGPAQIQAASPAGGAAPPAAAPAPPPEAAAPGPVASAVPPEPGPAATSLAPAPTAAPLPTAAAIPGAATPAVKKGPDRTRARALLAKGDAKRGQQDLEGAVKAYLAAEAADPTLLEVQKKLGLCYQQLGRDQEAAARYRRYLAASPPDAAKVQAILTTLQ